MDFTTNPIPGGNDGTCLVTVKSGFVTRKPSHETDGFGCGSGGTAGCPTEPKTCIIQKATMTLDFMLERCDRSEQKLITPCRDLNDHSRLLIPNIIFFHRAQSQCMHGGTIKIFMLTLVRY